MTIIILLGIILAIVSRLVNKNADEQKQLSGWRRIIGFFSIERALRAIRRRD
jgi:uncharacterized membrane protein (DUF106 family)